MDDPVGQAPRPGWRARESMRPGRPDERSHIPTHTFLARNVKPATFSPDTIDKTYHTWQNGGTPKLRVVGASLLPRYLIPRHT